MKSRCEWASLAVYPYFLFLWLTRILINSVQLLFFLLSFIYLLPFIWFYRGCFVNFYELHLENAIKLLIIEDDLPMLIDKHDAFREVQQYIFELDIHALDLLVVQELKLFFLLYCIDEKGQH